MESLIKGRLNISHFGWFLKQLSVVTNKNCGSTGSTITSRNVGPQMAVIPEPPGLRRVRSSYFSPRSMSHVWSSMISREFLIFWWYFLDLFSIFSGFLMTENGTWIPHIPQLRIRCFLDWLVNKYTQIDLPANWPIAYNPEQTTYLVGGCSIPTNQPLWKMVIPSVGISELFNSILYLYRSIYDRWWRSLIFIELFNSSIDHWKIKNSSKPPASF